jgi:predicted amidohydrolase YtcJ
VDTERFIKALDATDVPLRVRTINFMMRTDQPLVRGASGVKWILDGTPIERNAALRKPYAAGGEGRINFPDLAPLLKAGTGADQQILLHAAGDRTIAKILEAMDKAGTGWPARRLRIEHADGLFSDLVPAAKRHGVVAVLNPSHFPFCGAYPAGGYCPAKSLLKAGVPIAIGSDGPLNPFLNMMFATTHGGEALTREQVLTAYTAGSAFAEFAEKEKGKIAPGMLADIAVLSQDIFTVRPDELPATKSVLTIIDGVVVHSEL